MRLDQFLVIEKMASNAAQAQGFVYYDRVSINGVAATSPWQILETGAIVLLRPYDTNTRKNLEPITRTYMEIS